MRWGRVRQPTQESLPSRLTERADLAGPSRVGSFVVGCGSGRRGPAEFQQF